MISCSYHSITGYHNYNGIIPLRNGIRQLCIYRCGEREVLIEIIEVDRSGGLSGRSANGAREPLDPGSGARDRSLSCASLRLEVKAYC